MGKSAKIQNHNRKTFGELDESPSQDILIWDNLPESWNSLSRAGKPCLNFQAACPMLGEPARKFRHLFPMQENPPGDMGTFSCIGNVFLKIKSIVFG
jgi:hypothetical protein